MTDVSIAVVDYRLGNTHSVLRALGRCGITARLTSDPAQVAEADGLVIPGVGAFAPAMESLAETGCGAAIRSFTETGRPVLAICLGMQLLADESEEGGRHRGLGLLPGRVRRLAPPQSEGSAPVRVPQIGWNRLTAANGGTWNGTVFEGCGQSEMYFLHSFVVEPARDEDRVANTSYGGDTFCSGLRVGAVHGVQFHPELSADAGLRVFANFLRAARTARGE